MDRRVKWMILGKYYILSTSSSSYHLADGMVCTTVMLIGPEFLLISGADMRLNCSILHVSKMVQEWLPKEGEQLEGEAAKLFLTASNYEV